MFNLFFFFLQWLKELLKLSDRIYKSSQARMLSFTNNEFSGKGVKAPDIYQLQEPAPNIVSVSS